MNAQLRGKEILEEFAAFGAPLELLNDAYFISILQGFHDPHEAADAFLEAAPSDQARMRSSYADIADAKRRVAVANAFLPKVAGRKPGTPVTAAQELAIRDLAQGGCSVREIERRTGIGRATVQRRLDGVVVQRRGRKRAAAAA